MQYVIGACPRVHCFCWKQIGGLSLPWPAHIAIGIVWWPSFFCFRHGTGTGSPSRGGVRHFWRTLRYSRPFFQKCLRAGNLFFQVCRDRLYVFDSGRFSWNLFLNCDSGFAFLFWTETLFFSKKKDSLKWLFFEDSYWQAGTLYVLCFLSQGKRM